MANQAAANALDTSLTANFDVIRAPSADDAATISALIARCPPLDHNSLYATLLLCTHFAGTCAVAMRAERPVGWVSAYLPPHAQDCLFVWQVAVAPEVRALGLARQLIEHILTRPVCGTVHTLQTTITVDNEPSWSLFRSLAHSAKADLSAQPHFLRSTHFHGEHETEHLVTIAPITPSTFRNAR